MPPTEQPVFAPLLPTWTLWVQCAAAAFLAALVWPPAWLHSRRRRLAWPHRIQWLLIDRPALPGVPPIVSILGLAVLSLCLLNAGTWISPLCAALAAVSCLALAAQRWVRTLALEGLALMTAAIVLLPVAFTWRVEAGSIIWPLAAAMLALAAMTWFWHWLAHVWGQQLLDRRPWTPAGAMISQATTVGRISAVLGTALGVYLAGHTFVASSAGRLIERPSALWPIVIAPYLLLAGAAWWSARRTRTRWMHGLACLSLAALAAYLAAWLPAL